MGAIKNIAIGILFGLVVGSISTFYYTTAHLRVKTAKEEVRQAKAVGDIKVGDIKHEIKVKEKIVYVQAKKDSCGDSDMPDDLVTTLGGVHPGTSKTE